MVCLPVPPLPHINNCFTFSHFTETSVSDRPTVCVFVGTFRICCHADRAGLFVRLIRPTAQLTHSARGCTYGIAVLIVSCPATYYGVKTSVPPRFGQKRGAKDVKSGIRIGFNFIMLPSHLGFQDPRLECFCLDDGAAECVPALQFHDRLLEDLVGLCIDLQNALPFASVAGRLDGPTTRHCGRPWFKDSASRALRRWWCPERPPPDRVVRLRAIKRCWRTMCDAKRFDAKGFGAKERQRMAYSAAGIVAENLMPAVLDPPYSRRFEVQAGRSRASASCGSA